MPLGLSGSTIKSWFQYRCERKTRYEIMDPSELAAIPVAKDSREQPWAMLGIEYEDRVVKRALRDGLRSGKYADVSDDAVMASEEEIRVNPRSRSAKLRWGVRAE